MSTCRIARAASTSSGVADALLLTDIDRLLARGHFVRVEVVDVNEVHHAPIVVAQHRSFGIREDACSERLLDLSWKIERSDTTSLHAFDTHALFERLRGLGK